MKLKLHSRIQIAVEFSDVGVVKPADIFETTDERAAELIQLGYAEPLDGTPAIQPGNASKPDTKKKTSRRKAQQ